MIRVEGLRKNYASFPAVRDISFEVGDGEIVGFLGTNGAGKTTTLRILCGYMPATAGRVEVAGYDVVAQSREVRRRTGYLPEDVPLYRDMTVERYLRYIAGLKELDRRQIRSEVARVVHLAGLEPVVTRHIGKCSKGYRQRTGLAQALLGDPPVLLLDEPASGLDPNQVVEVRDLIRRLSGRKTVLLSSHILSEVSQICSRVLIIHDGTLVGSGTAASLAASAALARDLFLRVGGGLDTERLGSIEGVRAVRRAGEGAYRLAVEQPERTAPAVARHVVAAGVELFELRVEAADLEAVFRSLTGGGAHA